MVKTEKLRTHPDLRQCHSAWLATSNKYFSVSSLCPVAREVTPMMCYGDMASLVETTEYCGFTQSYSDNPFLQCLLSEFCDLIDEKCEVERKDAIEIETCQLISPWFQGNQASWVAVSHFCKFILKTAIAKYLTRCNQVAFQTGFAAGSWGPLAIKRHSKLGTL